jgi:uncharacterized membrane protein
VARWHEHPATELFGKDRLTLGQRAADALRNGMGSWGFVFISLVLLAVWMIYNGRDGFDPYPFILLNLVLSCVAALQGAILLIAARREDQINSELAVHTFQIDQENLELTRQVHELTLRIDQLTTAIHNHMLEKKS